MASPYQQQAQQRKILYIGLVVVLLTASWLFRSGIVEPKAEELTLRESKLGDVEVSGSALRLSLTGMRGFVVSVLWNYAIDAQKKNRWNEMELYVRSLTKLQPHFISPWLFQSWNLAYNVSVEADQVNDKLYFVARGTQLLAEGERQNKNNPELRFNVGFYQQHKIGLSDETNVFRCLYQMSCIPPLERHPDRFLKRDNAGRETLDLAEFEKFCQEHPQLVRRLRDKLRKDTPEQVVQFLKDNWRIPSLYSDDEKQLQVAQQQSQPPPLRDLPERFPVLPPPRTPVPPQQLYDEKELTHQSVNQLTDEFDAYAAARAWYGFAQEPVPPTDPDRPGKTQEITDRVNQRMPRMTAQLFRNYPPRSDSYIAERLQAEGWFDDKGWLITDWFPGNRFGDGKESRVGAGREWGVEGWRRATAHWQDMGRRTGLYLDPNEEATKLELARRYWKDNNMADFAEPPDRRDLKPGDPDHDKYKAALFMHWNNYYRTLTNYGHHLYRAEVEMEPDTVQARRAFFEAEQLRKEARRHESLDRYEEPLRLPRYPEKDALQVWKAQLIRFPKFRADDFMQEESYEVQLKYMRLLEDINGQKYLMASAASELFGQGAATPGPGWGLATSLRLAQLNNLPKPEVNPAPERRFDLKFRNPDNDNKEEDLVKEDVVLRVKAKYGLIKLPEGPSVEENIQRMNKMYGGGGGPGSEPPPPR